MLGDDLLRYNYTQKYMFLDKETEGLNLIHSRPIQCSWIITDLKNIYETHNYFIKWPNLNMSVGAANKIRFNLNEYTKVARDPKEIYDIYSPYLYDPQYIKVGHNILGYDSMIVQVWRRALGLKEDYSFVNNLIDTDALARAKKKNIKVDRENLTQWMFKMTSVIDKKMKTNLEKLGKEYEIDYDYTTLHDGLNDIILNFKVFQKLIWEVEI